MRMTIANAYRTTQNLFDQNVWLFNSLRPSDIVREIHTFSFKKMHNTWSLFIFQLNLDNGITWHTNNFSDITCASRCCTPPVIELFVAQLVKAKTKILHYWPFIEKSNVIRDHNGPPRCDVLNQRTACGWSDRNIEKALLNCNLRRFQCMKLRLICKIVKKNIFSNC